MVPAPAGCPPADSALGGEPGASYGMVALGAVGSLLVAIGAVGAGATLVHDPVLSGTVLNALRYGHGKTIATAAVYLGAGLLLLAWVRLGRSVRHGTADTRDMVQAIGAWTVPLLFAPPLFSRDPYIYLAQGAVANAGMNPYTTAPMALPSPFTDNAAGMWLSIPSPYGPLFILLVKNVVAVTGGNLILGVLVTRLLVVAGLVLLCVALPGLCRYLGARPASALWLGAANPLVLLHLVAGAHNDLLMVGLLVTGTVFVLGKAHVRGFAVVALAAAVKITAAVALPFLVWLWARHRHTAPGRSPTPACFAAATAAGATVVVVVFGLCTILAGVDLSWLGALGGNAVLDPWLSLPTAVGRISGAVLALFTDVNTATVVGHARMVGWGVLATVVVWLWWRSRFDDLLAVRGATVALLATVLLSAVTFPWYFSWPLALGAAIALSPSHTAVVAGASVWLVFTTHPDGATLLPLWGFAHAYAVSLIVAMTVARWDGVRMSPGTRLGGRKPRFRSG